MMLFPLEATIHCKDGRVGQLKYVVVDPDEDEVTHLIIDDKWINQDIVVPLDWVEKTSDADIMLNATIYDLETLPKYTGSDYTKLDPGDLPTSDDRPEETLSRIGPHPLGSDKSQLARISIQENEILLKRGMKVFIRGGKIGGTIDHILFEPDSHRMTHLVVQRGGIEHQAAYMIPVERVILTTDDSLWLNMEEEEFDQSPVYQTPASDEQIAARLQKALDTDVRTRGAGLRVDVQGGLVRFVGPKIDQVIDTASKIARSIQGVVGISNDIEAPPEPPLRIGEPVYAREVHYGTLAKVVVDPYKRQVTHVIVKHGKLLGQDRVIPFERVDRVEFDRIFIDATSEELDHYPRYEEKKFVEPLPGWEALDPDITADTLFWGGPYTGIAPFILPTIEHIVPVGVPKGELVLQRDTDVFYENDVIGALDHLLMDPTNGAVNYIVIRVTDSDQRVIVPAEWISQLDADAIVLNRWDPFQSGVPESEMMADDDIILADLTAHLHATPRLEKVNLLVDHHWVHLSGNVAKMEDKQAAESIARSTPGVAGVTSSLVSDTELVARVLSELAADRHTRPYTFNVNADRGVIILQGSVPREEIRAAAEAVVQRIAGVIKVINQLEILPEP